MPRQGPWRPVFTLGVHSWSLEPALSGDLKRPRGKATGERGGTTTWLTSQRSQRHSKALKSKSQLVQSFLLLLLLLLKMLDESCLEMNSHRRWAFSRA